MVGLRNWWNRFVREELGATAVEYGIMVALIVVVIIVAVAFIGTQLRLQRETVGGAGAEPNVAKAPNEVGK